MAVQDVPLSYRKGRSYLGGNVEVEGQFYAAGVPGGGVMPEDFGYQSWSMPTTSPNLSQLTVSGTLYLVRQMVRRDIATKRVHWIQNTAGATPTAGQNWAMLYASTGALLASVAIDDKVTGANGNVAATFASAPAIPASLKFVWVGLLFNAATAPTLARCGGPFTSSNNGLLAAAEYAFATNGTGLTGPPASITPASNVVGAGLFAAISET